MCRQCVVGFSFCGFWGLVRFDVCKCSGRLPIIAEPFSLEFRMCLLVYEYKLSYSLFKSTGRPFLYKKIYVKLTGKCEWNILLKYMYECRQFVFVMQELFKISGKFVSFISYAIHLCLCWQKKLTISFVITIRTTYLEIKHINNRLSFLILSASMFSCIMFILLLASKSLYFVLTQKKMYITLAFYEIYICAFYEDKKTLDIWTEFHWICTLLLSDTFQHTGTDIKTDKLALADFS